MLQGTIIEIARNHGYGFIESEDGPKVFFHQRWLRQIKFRDLKVGDQVVFNVKSTLRGLRAHNLLRAEDFDKTKTQRPIEAIFK